MGPELSAILTYIFGIIAIICSLCVVISRNPVTSAMNMALCFVATAAILFGLGAQFLGIVQLIVYAGAILVLFLFIVMMLDIKAEERTLMNMPISAIGVIVAGIFAGMVTSVALTLPGAHDGQCPAKAFWESTTQLRLQQDSSCSKNAAEGPPLARYGGHLPTLSPAVAAAELDPSISIEEAIQATSMPDTKLLGKKLFTEYNIAFVILGFALMAGTVGAVALGRRIRKD